MRLTWRFGVGIASVLAGLVAPYLARAETKLTYFNGMWRGSGSDRNSPLESLQRTSCQTTIQADLRRMNSNTVCDGQAGLHKVIDFSITLDGNQFTGDLSQSTIVRGSAASASVLKGSVVGRKAEDTARFQVQFPGLVPSAIVNFKIHSPSSYSMHVTSLGLTLMDVIFNRTDQR
jgi:hypothetical protein